MAINIPGFSKVLVGGQSRVIMRPSITSVIAEGGFETNVSINGAVYKVHSFTATGILTVTSAVNDGALVEYLVVAGGGGGSNGGGGAAAGGSGIVVIRYQIS
jgi:hypothetical protein